MVSELQVNNIVYLNYIKINLIYFSGTTLIITGLAKNLKLWKNAASLRF